MNKNVFSQLAAEFDRIERTINYQKEVIASMQKPPVCPCCKVPTDGRIYGIQMCIRDSINIPEFCQTLLFFFENCDAPGQLRIIQLAMNEYDRTRCV